MKYKIYQIKKDCEARKYLFMSLEYMRFNGYQPRLEDYTLVYEDPLAEGEDLDHIYSRFNMGRNPDDFKGHSVSVSDIIALEDGEGIKAYFVDPCGYHGLENFFPKREVELEYHVTKSITLSEEDFVTLLIYAYGEKYQDFFKRTVTKKEVAPILARFDQDGEYIPGTWLDEMARSMGIPVPDYSPDDVELEYMCFDEDGEEESAEED